MMYHQMYEWTPLAYAAYGGHVAIVELLINRGANIHAEDKVIYISL